MDNIYRRTKSRQKKGRHMLSCNVILHTGPQAQQPRPFGRIPPSRSGTNYQLGKKEGKWCWWYANGTIEKELEFENDQVADGLYTEYHPNGATREREKYVNGSLVDGTYIEYDTNGEICEIREHRGGQTKLLMRIEDGKVSTVERYISGHMVFTGPDPQLNTARDDSENQVVKKRSEIGSKGKSYFSTIIY